ncbi:MAG TPA: anti-sigma factor [Candidatus Acidoferrales bacterium]|nr:anti-sigma factor [Candidatus Acidoferrales bacterium]
MKEHIQFAEDVDLLALGLLGDEDCAPLRAHLESCEDCRTRYEESRSVAALLALSVPAAEPSAHVRGQLLERLRAERKPAGRVVTALHLAPGATGGMRERLNFWKWANLGWALVATLLLTVAIHTGVENRRVAHELTSLQMLVGEREQELARTRGVLDLLHSTGTVRVRLMSGTIKPLPEGRVFYHPKKGLLFFASNLPPLDEGKSYQLWYMPSEGVPSSAGVFAPDARGNATMMMPSSSMPGSPKAFAVTIEPVGGVAAPTGPEVLVGTLP